VGTLTVNGYRIEPLTMRTWDAFADLADRHNGVWGGCWCTYFHRHPDDPKEERTALGGAVALSGRRTRRGWVPQLIKWRGQAQ
jgi:hypothetical protein